MLFMIGAKQRNPSLWAEYDSLKESEWLSKDHLCTLQLENARQFFAFVEKHSPYYKKVFNSCGFSSSKLDDLAELKKIPPIIKSELIKKNKELHADYIFKKVMLAETSGTTGSALEFRKNEKWDSTNRANMFRSYDWYGIKPWDRYGYLWGYNISQKQAAKIKILDWAQNRFRLFSYDRKEIQSFSEKLASASYVAGYSSMIYEVAKTINELGLEKPELKMIKGTSEMILDVYQAEAKAAFGCKIVSEYGAAESGLIAFECPEGNMHINVESVIVEVDEENEIMVTNLASYSFPVIRYKLGDTVTLSEEPCSCGRAHPVIKEVVGRKGATVYGGNKTFPALTFYYVFKNLAIQKSLILNYKAVQKEKGIVDLYIEGMDNRRIETDIQDELKKYFNNDIDFNLLFVKAFEHKRKQSQYFESKLT